MGYEPMKELKIKLLISKEALGIPNAPSHRLWRASATALNSFTDKLRDRELRRYLNKTFPLDEQRPKNTRPMGITFTALSNGQPIFDFDKD